MVDGRRLGGGDRESFRQWQKKMRIRPRRRSGRGGGGKDFGSAAARKKKIKIFTKNLENEKIAKNIEKIDKNIDFGGARNKRTSPSNSTRKTTHIDLFSSLYD